MDNVRIICGKDYHHLTEQHWKTMVKGKIFETIGDCGFMLVLCDDVRGCDDEWISKITHDATIAYSDEISIAYNSPFGSPGVGFWGWLIWSVPSDWDTATEESNTSPVRYRATLAGKMANSESEAIASSIEQGIRLAALKPDR